MISSKSCGERVIVKSIRNVDEFHDLIYSDLPQVLSESNTLGVGDRKFLQERIVIVIIDSIGGMFRKLFDDSVTSNRSNE